MSNKISDKDKKDWNSFLLGKEKLSDKEKILKKKKFLKTTSIDLHGFTLEEANKTVKGITKGRSLGE